MDLTHHQGIDGKSISAIRRQSLMMKTNQGRVSRAESFGISDESSFVDQNS